MHPTPTGQKGSFLTPGMAPPGVPYFLSFVPGAWEEVGKGREGGREGKKTERETIPSLVDGAVCK